MLKCVYWALIQCEYQIQIDAQQMNSLMHFVNNVIGGQPGSNSADASLYKTSMEIQKKLREIAALGIV